MGTGKSSNFDVQNAKITNEVEGLEAGDIFGAAIEKSTALVTKIKGLADEELRCEFLRNYLSAMVSIERRIKDARKSKHH